MKVEFIPVTDYPASVEALANKQVDLAWFGGFTFVQANVRSGGKTVPLAQRAEDETFKSVFITKTDPAIKTLADLKGKNVSFGSQSSTSGHLMPRSFLLAAKMDPDKDFQRVAYSGAHDATIAAVAAARSMPAPWTSPCGTSSWPRRRSTPRRCACSSPRRPTSTTTGRCTPTCRPRCGKTVKGPARPDPATPEGKEILELQRATKFVPTKADNYKGMEAAARSAGLLNSRTAGPGRRDGMDQVS